MSTQSMSQQVERLHNLAIPSYLVGLGAMGRRIVSFDWSQKLPGPFNTCPHSLRSTVGLSLNASFLIKIDWREQALKESQRFLRSTTDALQCPIAVLDENGTNIEVNEAWRRNTEHIDMTECNFGVGTNHLEVSDHLSFVVKDIELLMVQGANGFPCS